MATGRYEAVGAEAEFEPGSRRRVLRNLLQITRVRDINMLESRALEEAQDAALGRYGAAHRFSAADICALHAAWLEGIYEWAGNYRTVNLAKDGFPFANARLIPGLMLELERGALRTLMPCVPGDDPAIAHALAVIHAELILIHPFREGNGRLSRLLAALMAAQAGLPQLQFGPLLGRGKWQYISAIHAAAGRDYAPLTAVFQRVIATTRRVAASTAR